MKKELRVNVVDMLLDQKFRNEAVGIIAELVKTHPAAVAAAYEKVVLTPPDFEVINGRKWEHTELNRLCSEYRDIVALMRSNQKVNAVRKIRDQYGFGLRDAVQLVNYAQRYGEVNWVSEGTFEPIDRNLEDQAHEIAAVIKKFY